jgi:hypothetical protein
MAMSVPEVLCTVYTVYSTVYCSKSRENDSSSSHLISSHFVRTFMLMLTLTFIHACPSGGHRVRPLIIQLPSNRVGDLQPGPETRMKREKGIVTGMANVLYLL